MNENSAAGFHNAIKCAAVFRTVDGEFHFVCEKCSKTTQDGVLFIQHLAQHFDENPDLKQPVVQLSIMHVTAEDTEIQSQVGSPYLMKQEFEMKDDYGEDDDGTEYYDESFAAEDVDTDEMCTDDVPRKSVAQQRETIASPNRIIQPSDIKTDVDELTPIQLEVPAAKSRKYLDRDPFAKSRKRSEIHSCPDCSMTFKSEKVLSQHCLILHAIRPFRCDQCPQTFSNSSKLNVHMNYHNKQLECDICHKMFALKSSIYFHLLTHVKEKQYECTFCHAKLRYKYQILQHKRKHGLVESLPGIVCELCGKTVQFPNQMREHMRRHNQQRVYKCTACDKGFVNSGGLRTHFRRVHTNAVPFKCRWCDKMFRNYDARKAHERKMHDGEPLIVKTSP